MNPKLLSALLLLVPLVVRAQAPDHLDTPPAAAAKGGGPGAGQAKGGRGAGGGGGRFAAEGPTDLNAIIANPADLEKGHQLFVAHCVQCHGPKGEGDRGPNLAQPNLPRAADDASLLRIVRGGITGTEMPAPNLKPGQAQYIAAYVKSLGQRPPEVVPGDPAKGAELFKTKGACLQCHTNAGQGMAIGPDLTDVGRRRSSVFLRRALVNPSADVPQDYSPYRQDISLPINFMFIQVKTKDGKEFAGVRVNESAYSIQIRDMTGRIHSFFKDELADLKKNKDLSPMPVYAGLFTPTEMDDMVAYLVSLRGEKK